MDTKNSLFIDGQYWIVLSKGAERDGKTFCHLASTLHGTWQKNGFYPDQMCDWVESERVKQWSA